MKKKLIAVFLVVATLLSCVFAFAACDKDKDKNKDGKNGGTNNEVYDGTFNLANVESVLRYLMAYVSTSNEDFPDIHFVYSKPTDNWGGGSRPEYSIRIGEGDFSIFKYFSKADADAEWADREIGKDEYFARLDDTTIVYCDYKSMYEDIKNADLSKCKWPEKIVEDMITYAKQVQIAKKGGVIISDMGFSFSKEHPGLVEFKYSQNGDFEKHDIDSWALTADAPESTRQYFNSMVNILKQLSSDSNAVEILGKSENYIKVKYKNK